MKAEKSGFQDLSTASSVTFWSTPTHTRGGGPQSHTQLLKANASGSKDALILTKDNWRPLPRATFLLLLFFSNLGGCGETLQQPSRATPRGPEAQTTPTPRPPSRTFSPRETSTRGPGSGGTDKSQGAGALLFSRVVPPLPYLLANLSGRRGGLAFPLSAPLDRVTREGRVTRSAWPSSLPVPRAIS